MEITGSKNKSDNDMEVECEEKEPKEITAAENIEVD